MKKLCRVLIQINVHHDPKTGEFAHAGGAGVKSGPVPGKEEFPSGKVPGQKRAMVGEGKPTFKVTGKGKPSGGYAEDGTTLTEIGKIGERTVLQHYATSKVPESWSKAVNSNGYTSPIDLLRKERGVTYSLEIKSLPYSSWQREAKIRMREECRMRKRNMADKFTKGRVRTVIVLLNEEKTRAALYVKEGLGDYRVSGAQKVGEFDVPEK